jgi:hypothetical protein
MSTMKNESGQAVTEYILMVAVVVGLFLAVETALTKTGLNATMMTPLTKNYYFTYKYGHPKALGYDEAAQGGPSMHPRITTPGNFRIFIDPGASQ